LIIST